MERNNKDNSKSIEYKPDKKAEKMTVKFSFLKVLKTLRNFQQEQ